MKYSPVIFLIIFILFYGCDRLTQTDTPEDNLPPAQPQNLSIYSAYDGVIVIQWDNNTEPDLTGYIIYRSVGDTSDFNKLTSTQSNFYVDDSLEYNTEYFYRISATDRNNRESSKSKVVSAKPVNKYRPLNPLYLEINARNWDNDVSIVLFWQQAEETDVIGYNIYRSDQANFNADSSSLLAFSPVNNFTDKNNLEFYKNYYYKIKAVDQGHQLSDPSTEVTDLIFEIPEMISPPNNSTTEYFDNFLLKAVKHPATYKIILQTNQYFDEIWSKEMYSIVLDDTIAILFDASYIYSGRKYYWRVATYSGFSSEPNSISELHSFTIKK